jgi:benzodiazapine receptor
VQPRRSVLSLAAFAAVVFAAAAVGSLATRSSLAEWYVQLQKPSWTPPGWVFGPVWILLYATMAVAAWMVWRRSGRSRAAVPLALFALQLALNAAWPLLFFGLRAPGKALVGIAALWLAVVATIVAFRRFSTLSALLMVPYGVWVTFAAALNLAIYRMNP